MAVVYTTTAIMTSSGTHVHQAISPSSYTIERSHQLRGNLNRKSMEGRGKEGIFS